MNDREMKEKLMEFEVEVPEFPMRKSVMDRWGNWLFSETVIPSPHFSLTKSGMTLIHCLPFPIIIIAILPFLI